MEQHADIVICGAGIAGIATAHALGQRHGKTDILILDPRAPMSLTSAASGENYRNWWPHPRLAEFASRGIDLTEQLAGADGENFRFSRRGYAYVTRREDPDALAGELHKTYGGVGAGDIRLHDTGDCPPAIQDGADVLTHRDTIRKRFPHLCQDVSAVTLVRRAGDFDSQQLGQFMLSQARRNGARLLPGELVSAAAHGGGFRLEVHTTAGVATVATEIFINAAGPFAGKVAAMLDVVLPLQCVYREKIAFEDHLGVVPRTAPFTIDLDEGPLGWPEDARALLAEDPETAWLAETQPGGVHVRPEGGANSRWIKLGWPLNGTASEPVQEPRGSDTFPEIVMRGAARMVPGLERYCDALPRALTHYGGYYTRTRENWPLIGPMGPDGAFMVAGLSGYGSMTACAAGELCAAWVMGTGLPGYARDFSLARYHDAPLMARLLRAADDGEL